MFNPPNRIAISANVKRAGSIENNPKTLMPPEKITFNIITTLITE